MSDYPPNAVLALLAPTACGKTDLMIQWAKKYPIEVVSVDSAMVYRELSIGANKLTEQELQQCPHHLVDVTTIEQGYDVSRFFHESAQAIDDILHRGKIPVLVGGTMMYVIQAQRGLAPIPQIDPQKRQEFWQSFDEKSLEERYEELKHFDPELAAKLASADRQRICRGLEVVSLTGKKLTEYWKQPAQKYPYDLDLHALKITSASEHQRRIYQRARVMLQAGFIAEVEALKKSHGSQDYDFWSFVGYRQVRAYVEGLISEEELEQAISQSTWQLVKRQKTWLRKENIPQWEMQISQGHVEENFCNIFEKYCSFVLEKGISRSA